MDGLQAQVVLAEECLQESERLLRRDLGGGPALDLRVDHLVVNGLRAEEERARTSAEAINDWPVAVQSA